MLRSPPIQVIHLVPQYCKVLRLLRQHPEIKTKKNLRNVYAIKTESNAARTRLNHVGLLLVIKDSIMYARVGNVAKGGVSLNESTFNSFPQCTVYNAADQTALL